MPYLLLITATIMATTLMTIFSILVAMVFHQPYEEPFLLSRLAGQLTKSDTINRYIGWSLHYFLGLLFVIGFHLLLTQGWITLSWQYILLYGAVIGLIGIIGWKFMFSVSSKKPQMNYKGYYLQLFFAHIVFAFTVAGCFIVAQTICN